MTIFVGQQYAGQTVYVWLHSTPISLGAHIVAADGTVTVTLPAGIEPGAHKLVVLDAQGNLLGWAPVTVPGRLPATGADAAASVTTGLAAAGLIAAGVMLAMRRRRAEV